MKRPKLCDYHRERPVKMWRACNRVINSQWLSSDLLPAVLCLHCTSLQWCFPPAIWIQNYLMCSGGDFNPVFYFKQLFFFWSKRTWIGVWKDRFWCLEDQDFRRGLTPTPGKGCPWFWKKTAENMFQDGRGSTCNCFCLQSLSTLTPRWRSSDQMTRISMTDSETCCLLVSGVLPFMVSRVFGSCPRFSLRI